MNLPILIWWLLIFYSIRAPIQVVLYLTFISITFGSLSLLPPGVLGNVPLSTICAAVLIAKTFVPRGRMVALADLAFDVRKLGLLTLLMLYVLVTSYLYPRMFQGEFRLFPLNGAGTKSLLHPTSSNITQPIYLAVSCGSAFVFAYAGQSPLFRKHFLWAVLVGALVLLVSGYIDFGLNRAGHVDWLSSFHNATYRVLDHDIVADQTRVVGIEPEASSFGGATIVALSLMVFLRRSYTGILRKFVVPATALGLAHLAYLSTSSGAFIGLAVLAVLMAGQFIAEIMFAHSFGASMLQKILLVTGGGVLGAIGLTLVPASELEHIHLVLDSVVFQKQYSSSYIERHSWTQAGIDAFWHTNGVGVGVGSVRTSNWGVNFAASTGIVGLVIFGLFVLKTFLPPAGRIDPECRLLARSLKLAFIPGLTISLLSGTTPDPGVDLMITFGMIYASTRTPRRSAAPNPVNPAIVSPGRVLTKI